MAYPTMRMTYNTILIDDESNSLELLEWQINKCCPELKINARCSNPEESINIIQAHKPDLIFLDIEMPEMSGFQLLEKLGPFDFDVIFTTAYDEFAVKAFKVNALDYLIKPIDVKELRSAVDKFDQRRKQFNPYLTGKKNDVTTLPQKKRVALTTAESLVFVDTDDVIYCESNSNYTYFHLKTPDKKILVSKTLKEVEETMTHYDFFRIHNSYLVNMKHIKELTRGAGGYIVMSNGDHLSVSRTRKEEFFEMFSKF